MISSLKARKKKFHCFICQSRVNTAAPLFGTPVFPKIDEFSEILWMTPGAPPPPCPHFSKVYWEFFQTIITKKSWSEITYLRWHCYFQYQLADCSWHGINHDLLLSFPLRPPSCIRSTPTLWPDKKQRAQKVGSKGRWEESSTPKTTEIGLRFPRMSGRQSTWCQLYGKEECDSQWPDLSSLVSFADSWWAWTTVCWGGRA